LIKSGPPCELHYYTAASGIRITSAFSTTARPQLPSRAPLLVNMQALEWIHHHENVVWRTLGNSSAGDVRCCRFDGQPDN
jgi:hypothetical protein